MTEKVGSNEIKGREVAYLLRLAWEHKRNQINRCLLHDLSNQWGGVLALSELYCKNPKSDSLAEGLRIIQESALQGRDLLTLLSRFNYPSNEQATYLDIPALLKQLDPIIKAILPKNVSFNVQCSEKLPPVRAVQNHVQQIFLQLLFNAGEAVRTQSKPTIELRLEADNTNLHVYVSDNGRGFPKALLEQIFHPFCTDLNDEQHLGLGLYAVHTYLKELGGQIVLEPSEMGTTFHLILPTIES